MEGFKIEINNNPFTLSDINRDNINLIRIIATQIVLIGHNLVFFPVFPFLQPPYIPQMQQIGVIIFFLISGFLIPFSLFSKKDHNENYNFKNYYFDRFSRIYSGLIPAIIFIIFLNSLTMYLYNSSYGYLSNFPIIQLIGNLLLIQGNNDFQINPFSRPWWTLSIQWWIYLSFGWLVLGSKTNKKLSNKIFYIIFLVLLSIYPIYNLVFESDGGITLVWVMGAICYLILSRKKIKPSSSFTLSTLFFILSIIHLNIHQRIFEYSRISLHFFGLLSISLFFFLHGLYSISSHFKEKIDNLKRYRINKKGLFFLSTAFFFLALMVIYITKYPYNSLFFGLLAISFLLFIYSFNSTEKKYNNKFKRIIKGLLFYSLTLYLIQYSISYFFLVIYSYEILPPLITFFISCIVSNIIAAIIGYFFEKNYKKLNIKLKKLLNLIIHSNKIN